MCGGTVGLTRRMLEAGGCMATLLDQPPIILCVDDDPEARELLPRLIHSFAPCCEIVAVLKPPTITPAVFTRIATP